MFLCPWNCVKSYRALPGACHTLLTADRRPKNGHALSPSEKSSVDLAEVFSRQWHSSVVAVVNSRLHGFINASRPLSSGGTNSKRRFYKYLIARRRLTDSPFVSRYERIGAFRADLQNHYWNCLCNLCCRVNYRSRLIFCEISQNNIKRQKYNIRRSMVSLIRVTNEITFVLRTVIGDTFRSRVWEATYDSLFFFFFLTSSFNRRKSPRGFNNE